MKHICIYMPTASYLTGGAEIVAINQCLHLYKKKYKITFITIKPVTKSEHFKKLLGLDIEIIYLNTNNISQEIIDNNSLSHKNFHKLYTFLGKELNKYISDKSFDLIISHYAPAGIYIPKNIPSCMILHGTPTKISKLDKLGVFESKYIIAVSNSIKEGREHLLGIDKNIYVVHNGIDINTNEYEKEVKADIFFIGRNIKIKGIQYLIRAINRIKKKYGLTLHTIIGGEGPYQRELINLVKKYELENNVSFIGYINKNELYGYYNNSKIIVLPSYQKEGVLTTMLEAATCGSCIITCDCCGMKDFIINGYNGILCKPKDYKDLGKKILLLINDKKNRKNLGKNAKRTIKNGWTWTQAINNFIKVTRI